ncbi:FMN-binding negative transcriptional regulator [Candidatus Dactylopiibacterium carminicum]|uniref:FMN-binding negative transcriptional regulator n=1 Tax=Candidatus Dactylopiibacterium carminicum TaxID=857335 RepID=UPI0021DF4373|nr:FMN-binding negative transcriptional regulator [Candidatus Dactylopiibacterium carminicum]
MYRPEHFKETNPDELHAIIRQHPLGVLVTHSAAGLDANHLPFEFVAGRGALGSLQAHVARANPLWQETPAGTEVMVVFRGGAGLRFSQLVSLQAGDSPTGADLELRSGSCPRAAPDHR